MVITHFNENVIKCFLLIGDTHFFKGRLIIPQIIQYLYQLIGQAVDKIGNDFAGEHQFITAVIFLNNPLQAFVKFNGFHLICPPIGSNRLAEQLQQRIKASDRHLHGL